MAPGLGAQALAERDSPRRPAARGHRVVVMRVRWLAYAPAMLWTVFVLWLGSRTWDGVVQDWDWQPNDKLLHFWMYGTLGFLLSLGWRAAGRQPRPALLVLAGVLVGLYDELHQRTVPGRSADYRDFIVDVVAVMVGFVLVNLIQRLTQRRTRRPESS